MEKRTNSHLKQEKSRRERPVSSEKSGGKTVLRILIGVLATILIGAAFFYAAGYIVIHGPSERARELFVRTIDDTMTLDPILRLYLSEEEIHAIVQPAQVMQGEPAESSEDLPLEVSSVNASMIAETVAATSREDMIELIDISGTNWRGKMILVHDPALVTVAAPDSYSTYAFKQISDWVEDYGGIAGITATGFYKNLKPYGYVIKDGKIIYGAGTSALPCVGFDADHVLHVKKMTPEEALEEGIICGVTWRPILIQDGVRKTGLAGGVSPRAAIGQRADGTVLLVVIEGRSLGSIGATYDDLADLFEEYGAVNAINLDSGRSAVMVYNGEILTKVASGSGSLDGREMPNAFVVLSPEVNDD